MPVDFTHNRVQQTKREKRERRGFSNVHDLDYALITLRLGLNAIMLNGLVLISKNAPDESFPSLGYTI